MDRTLPQSISNEIAQEAADLRNEGLSIRAGAERLGISKSAFHDRLKRAAERGMLGTKPVLPGFAIKSTSAQTDKDGNIEREWVQQGKEPGEPFQLPDGQLVRSLSVLTDGNGREMLRWTKTREDTCVPDLVEALKGTFDAYTGKSELIHPPARSDADLMSVYPIVDQHHGMLGWRGDASENYDVEIGSRRLLTSASRLIAQSPPSRNALILNLGDWQHTDDAKNMTPRSGHILDVDGRYFKVLTTGVKLFMQVIELALQRHEIVTVRNLPGNHDPHASIALTVALAAFYDNNPRVVIDQDPSDFFFHEFGQTLIGANHGHKMKPADMAMTMAVRRREAWGRTRYHWFLFGHIHHETAKEIGDVRVESFQTLAGKDAHAHSCGYSSGQSLTSVTLHIEDGEIGRHRVNIPPPSVEP